MKQSKSQQKSAKVSISTNRSTGQHPLSENSRAMCKQAALGDRANFALKRIRPWLSDFHWKQVFLPSDWRSCLTSVDHGFLTRKFVYSTRSSLKFLAAAPKFYDSKILWNPKNKRKEGYCSHSIVYPAGFIRLRFWVINIGKEPIQYRAHICGKCFFHPYGS